VITSDLPLTAADVAEILNSIPSRPSYGDWIEVIAAVGNTLTEHEAISVLSAWSPEETAGEYGRKLHTRPQRVGIGSLIARAKLHGFDASAFARRRANGCVHPARVTPRPTPKPPAVPQPAKPLRIPHLSFPGIAELVQIQHVRGWPVFVGMEIAARRGLLHVCRVVDDGIPRDAWALTDSARRSIQVRRMDGLQWVWNSAKAWSLGGSLASWPLGCADIEDRPIVLLCEGGPDSLAAHALAWIADRSDRAAVVGLPGASAAIHPDALPFFAGRRVRICEHRDTAGEKAGPRWAAQLAAVGAIVDGFTPPAPFKDLADVLAATDAEHINPPCDIFEGIEKEDLVCL
jgi:hypothetical protein